MVRQSSGKIKRLHAIEKEGEQEKKQWARKNNRNKQAEYFMDVPSWLVIALRMYPENHGY